MSGIRKNMPAPWKGPLISGKRFAFIKPKKVWRATAEKVLFGV